MGEEGDDYTYRYAVSTRNDTCIKVGSDERHFTVSFIVRDKVTRQCPQTTTFYEEKGEWKRNRAEVPSAYQPYRLTAGPNLLTHRRTSARFCFHSLFSSGSQITKQQQQQQQQQQKVKNCGICDPVKKGGPRFCHTHPALRSRGRRN